MSVGDWYLYKVTRTYFFWVDKNNWFHFYLYWSDVVSVSATAVISIQLSLQVFFMLAEELQCFQIGPFQSVSREFVLVSISSVTIWRLPQVLIHSEWQKFFIRLPWMLFIGYGFLWLLSIHHISSHYCILSCWFLTSILLRQASKQYIITVNGYMTHTHYIKYTWFT